MHAWLGIFILTLLIGCDRSPSVVRLSGEAFATTWSVIIAESIATADQQYLQQQIARHLDGFDQRFSTWRADSELSRFNASEHLEWVPVSTELYAVIAPGQQLAERTDGAFDMTLAPLIQLWGFANGQQRSIPPDRAEIEALTPYMGYRKLRLKANPPALQKRHPKLRLDVSAIAKGAAVDEVMALLSGRYKHVLVEIGGEVRTIGQYAGKPWRVALENPLKTTSNHAEIVALHDLALASSGNYRQYFTYQGRRYGHTLSGKTDEPVQDGYLAVSVIAENTMMADALATALLAMTEKEARQFALDQSLAARLVSEDNAIYVTPKFAQYLVHERQSE